MADVDTQRSMNELISLSELVNKLKHTDRNNVSLEKISSTVSM